MTFQKLSRSFGLKAFVPFSFFKRNGERSSIVVRRLTAFCLVWSAFSFAAVATFAENSSRDSVFPDLASPTLQTSGTGLLLGRYPAFAKIVCQGPTKKTDDEEISSFYYGSGVYVAEQGDFGIVLTNAHVIAEAEGTIQIHFADYSSEGIVLLVDEVWDLAALIIRKPPFLPVPISLEVPLVGDKLWLAGFGQAHDLSGFRMTSGPVYKYAFLGLYPDLPAETIAIETGIRHGDSGGPILNQYGELAGLIWGSDGAITTGTFCLRLQAFLTQTQFQLMNQRKNADELFAANPRIKPKRILMASTPAQKALEASGVYPISTVPVYMRSAQKIDDFLNFGKKGEKYPPYPAIVSPTYIAQTKAIGREHPETSVAENSSKDSTVLDNMPASSDVSKNATSVPKEAEFLEVSDTKQNSSVAIVPRQSLEENPNSSSPVSPSSYNVSSDSEQTLVVPDSLDDVVAVSNDEISENGPSVAEKSVSSNDSSSSDNPSWLNGKLKIIIVVFMIFFFFYHSVRFLAFAYEKDEK